MPKSMYIPTKQTKNKKIDCKGTVRIISNFRHNNDRVMTHMIRWLRHKQLVKNLRSFPTECMHQRTSQFKSSPNKLLPGRTTECVTKRSIQKTKMHCPEKHIIAEASCFTSYQCYCFLFMSYSTQASAAVFICITFTNCLIAHPNRRRASKMR